MSSMSKTATLAIVGVVAAAVAGMSAGVFVDGGDIAWLAAALVAGLAAIVAGVAAVADASGAPAPSSSAADEPPARLARVPRPVSAVPLPRAKRLRDETSVETTEPPEYL